MSSSEEDVPAPSPSAAVVARRASREAKSMREESGSDKDAEEPEEWDDDGEASSDAAKGPNNEFREKGGSHISDTLNSVSVRVFYPF